MTAVECRKLTKAYGREQAVKGLELSIGTGELFSLLGVNGAGKTTTIRMLSGLSAVTSGEAFLCGFPVGSREAKALCNLSPQETAISPNLTVFENLVFSAQIYGKSRRQARADAAAMERLLLPEAVRDKRAKLLSGGMQRRLSIAMALITEPSVLFLDEPTLGLDVLARRELWQVINRLKGKVTILLTTHYMEEAEKLSDRIALLHNGVLLGVGTLPELRGAAGLPQDASLEDVFVKMTEEAQKGEG